MSDNIITFSDKEVGFGGIPTDNRFELFRDPKFYPVVNTDAATLVTNLSTSHSAYVMSAEEDRVGNIVTIYLRFGKTASTIVAVADNLCTATWNGTRPPYDIETFAYNGGNGFVLRIEPSGALTVRHVSNVRITYGTGEACVFSFTFITDSI